MKAQKFAKLAVAVAAVVLTVTAARAVPTTVTLTVDPSLPPTNGVAYVLGAANPGTPADPVDQTAFVNGVLGLALGGSGTVHAVTSSQTDAIYRSLNVFSGLPAYATSVNNIFNSGNTTSLTLTAGYAFLVAKYDGGNGGTEIWYVGGLAAGTVIDIPLNAFGDGNGQYGLSGTTFLEGSSTPPPVPDGGSTLALLGLGLLSTLMFVRKVKTA